MGTLGSIPARLHGGPCARAAAKPGPEPGALPPSSGHPQPWGARLRGRVGQTSPDEGLLGAERFLSVTWVLRGRARGGEGEEGKVRRAPQQTLQL